MCILSLSFSLVIAHFYNCTCAYKINSDFIISLVKFWEPNSLLIENFNIFDGLIKIIDYIN